MAPYHPLHTDEDERLFPKTRLQVLRERFAWNLQRLPLGRSSPRAAFFLFLVLPACASLFLLSRFYASRQSPLIDGVSPPPSFSRIRDYERTLPQHNFDLPYPEGKEGRYLRLPNESWGTGWNNVFQEQLLNTHLAYLSNRGYVFVDYIARDHPPFPDEVNGHRNMLHIPMNAFTSGPTGGGLLGENDKAPRAISEEWWNTVCPPHKVKELHMAETVNELSLNGDSDGAERMEKWAKKLRGMTEGCVSIVGGMPFDYMLIGGDKILSIWPLYHNSPVIKNYAWSRLIRDSLINNHALLSSSPKPSFNYTSIHDPPLDGLLAMHVRRGDYEGHCKNLASWGAGYNAWSALGSPNLPNAGSHPIVSTPAYPILPDHLDIPSGMSREDAALRHCWPSLRAIVEKAHVVRKAHPALKRVFVMTNGNKGWVDALGVILKEEGWEAVHSSLDLDLGLEEIAVSQGIDMAIAYRAEVFIGNGFSSMSSNVVQLRLAAGLPVDSIRFW